MKEIWKDVVEYEGLYQVSNLGNIKSIGRKSNHKSTIYLKQFFDKGYMFVNLHKDKRQKRFKYIVLLHKPLF